MWILFLLMLKDFFFFRPQKKKIINAGSVPRERQLRGLPPQGSKAVVFNLLPCCHCHLLFITRCLNKLPKKLKEYCLSISRNIPHSFVLTSKALASGHTGDNLSPEPPGINLKIILKPVGYNSFYYPSVNLE